MTNLILCHYHQLVKHQGCGIAQNEIRLSGYWIIGGSSVVSNHISKCVSCRKLRGPWYIKEGHREVKYYGVLFTCLASRAVHLKVAGTMRDDRFLRTTLDFQGNVQNGGN